MTRVTCSHSRAGAFPSGAPSSSPVDDRGCRIIARAALAALYRELWAYPKPGLVSFIDSGSHKDMDALTFMRSLSSLRGYFREIASVGAGNADFDELRRAGRLAEDRMLKATGNVNTHRGAVFTLGLLASAASHVSGARDSFEGDMLGRIVCERWGKEILLSAPNGPCSHGSLVALQYGAAGAREEAAAGFPHLFTVGLPALREALSKGVDVNGAIVQSFFSLMAVVPDNNLLFRGGTQGLLYAKAAARAFLERGGAYRDKWREHGRSIHHAFIARRLSPGGSADLLAATLFVHALQTGMEFDP